MPKTTFRIFILFALALGSISFTSVEAKSTRSFSGSNPAEVEKNAKKAGFDYPDGEMECSSRCNQRWAKEWPNKISQSPPAKLFLAPLGNLSKYVLVNMISG